MNRICLNRYPEGKKKALILSYDDAQTTDIRMVELLNEFGIKAAFHLNSGRLGMPGYMKALNIKKEYDGHEIAAHTLMHPHLAQLPKDQMLYEILEDRRRLEEITGQIVEGFSYPFGEWKGGALGAVKAAGFSYARTIKSSYCFIPPPNFIRWHPTCHHREGCIELGKQYLEVDYREGLSVFLLWGHSHNFEKEKNWNVLEEFCRLMGNREEFWYCTPARYVQYMEALKMLKTSVSGDCAQNLSGLDIWLEWDEKAVKIPPGSMIRREEIQ